MKKGIHPNYVATEIRCACGAVVETRSTKENLTVQVCSSCHPFFTGKQKLVDTAGRIDRFAKKFSGKTVSAQKAHKQVNVGPAPKKTKAEKAEEKAKLAKKGAPAPAEAAAEQTEEPKAEA